MLRTKYRSGHYRKAQHCRRHQQTEQQRILQLALDQAQTGDHADRRYICRRIGHQAAARHHRFPEAVR